MGMAGSAHRSDSIVSMPSPAARTLSPAPNRTAWPRKVAHRASRRIDQRLAQPVRGDPGAMHAGDRARQVGDGGDHRRPRLRRRMLIRAIPAARMEAERFAARQMYDPAVAQVRLGQGAGDRLGDGPEPARSFGPSPSGRALLPRPAVRPGAATGSAAPPRRPRGTPRARNSRGSRRAGRRARPRPHRSSARRPQGRTPARSAARTSTGRACCAHRPTIQ